MSYAPYIQSLYLKRESVECWEEFPFCVPAIRRLGSLEFHPKATFLIGENGSGKSTLLEALAQLEGFHPEGGTRNFNFASREHRDEGSQKLKWHLGVRRGVMGKLRRDGFFFRAESFYNVATYIEEVDLHRVRPRYGDRSLHCRSHGEAFLTLITEALQGGGLYLFDEPEAALSPQRQLTFLAAMHRWIENETQLVIATHSPIIMAYPDAWIYRATGAGFERIEYKDTEHYRITHAFLAHTERMLKELLSP